MTKYVDVRDTENVYALNQNPVLTHISNASEIMELHGTIIIISQHAIVLEEVIYGVVNSKIILK